MLKNFILFLCLATGLFADGFEEYRNGNFQKAVEFYKKACDGQIERGCEEFNKLIDKTDQNIVIQS